MVTSIDLDHWIADHFIPHPSVGQVRKWRKAGKVNVNGQVVYDPIYPKHQIEHSADGRRRIMVEGVGMEPLR